MHETIFIAHRGNLNGPNKARENTVSYINKDLSLGYECEIDVWLKDERLYLGHDEPTNLVTFSYLHKHRDHLWVHCKNLEALEVMLENDFHCFFHDKDTYTLTSKGHIWGNVDSPLTSNMICVMPELYAPSLLKDEILQCKGICSDYVSQWSANKPKSVS